MNTILVPTDYSKQARHAFGYALKIANSTKANVVLFHAFHQPISVHNAFRINETILDLEKEQEEILTAWADEVKNEIYQDACWQFNSTVGLDQDEQITLTRTRSGFHTIENMPEFRNEVNLTCICKFGVAAEEINPAAKKYKADLVLMSSKGAGAIGQALLGSTVSAVISSSEVPVLTLPQQGDYKKLQTFVFASDLSLCSDSTILDNLRTLVKTFRADLKVLHLHQEKYFSLEQKNALIGLDTLDINLFDINYQVYFRQSHEIVTGIYEFVLQQQADVLVLVHKRRQFLEILLKKSVTGNITKQGFIPFLTLPYPR